MAQVGYSVTPLKEAGGHTYGAVVSFGEESDNSAVVPDQLLDSFTRIAGTHIERAWKLGAAEEAISTAEGFIKSSFVAAHPPVLAYVKVEKGAQLPRNDDPWQWQPLAYTSPSDSNVFEVQLKWKSGEPIAVLRVTCGTFTKMDEKLVLLLQTVRGEQRLTCGPEAA